MGKALSKSPKRLVIVLAIGAILVAAVTAMVWPRRAQITGRTAEDRIDTIGRLADEQPRGAADAIKSAATDPDAGVRQAALVCLGRFKRPEDRGTIEAGTRDASEAVRAAAAGTLGFYADDDAADRLGEILTTDTAPAARLGATQGLARAGGAKAYVFLAEAMDQDPDPQVRLKAMQRLLRLMKLRRPNPPDPRDLPKWRALTAKIRAFHPVQEAFEKVRPPAATGGQTK